MTDYDDQDLLTDQDDSDEKDYISSKAEPAGSPDEDASLEPANSQTRRRSQAQILALENQTYSKPILETDCCRFTAFPFDDSACAFSSDQQGLPRIIAQKSASLLNGKAS